jgi:branched-chain amino acid transport system substrate-binding protein
MRLSLDDVEVRVGLRDVAALGDDQLALLGGLGSGPGRGHRLAQTTGRHAPRPRLFRKSRRVEPWASSGVSCGRARPRERDGRADVRPWTSHPGGVAMAERWQDEPWAKEMWWRGKTTRRRFLGVTASAAGALGAAMLVPAPWRAAFGQAKPYKIGILQPLSGVAAAGGKTALVGTMMAIDHTNKAGGVNGRPVEAVVADYESKPDVGRRKAEKLLAEDEVDVAEGGYLSNVCLACMPVFEEYKTVWMIGVCLDTTITTTKCSRYVFRPFDYAPAQAVAFAPYLVKKVGKRWHVAYLDYAWGQSTRDAYIQEIKKAGGEIVETTGIPLGTADMTPFLSKISGNFDGLFGIFFGVPAVTFTRQAYDLGLTKRYRYAGDGAVAESTHLPALAEKIEGFVGINRYVPVLDPPLNTAAHKKFFDEAVARLKQIDPSGPLPDRYVQSNFEAMNTLKVGIQKSGFQGRQDTPKLIEALEGLEVKESDDFPQGDKTLRREDHQAFLREFIFDISGGKHRILQVVPKEKTMLPPNCKFA